eukprot:gb/GEZN01011999.1/.p1 GENE.gb/GEZN01011999.1/~~gb/GEZN01011999.1/.p1  ORF type:complete len:289 (+),score=33.99 gb/GEZN01011999.1/:132-998(+)
MEISHSERVFIRQGVEQNVRNDGRGRMDYRFFNVQTDVIPHANGSARLKLDSTEVLVAVKCEVEVPSTEFPDRGQITVNVDCSTSVLAGETQKQKNLSAQLTSDLALSLSQPSSLDFSSLCLIQGKSAWHIYVDAMVLSLGGNVLDALSMACNAAMQTCTLPRLEVIESGEDKEAELSLSDDPYDTVPLNASQVPIIVSLYKIGACFVVDPSAEEEQCVAAWLRVGVNRAGKLCGIVKGGGGGLAPSAMLEMTKYAVLVGTDLLAKLSKQVISREDGEADSGGQDAID